jgi:predicted HicB family RNase H-like nuclease
MGRKKMKPGLKVDIRLRVDEEFAARIQAVADRRGNSVAAYIRSVVSKDVEREEKEAAR